MYIFLVLRTLISMTDVVHCMPISACNLDLFSKWHLQLVLNYTACKPKTKTPLIRTLCALFVPLSSIFLVLTHCRALP